MPLPVFRPFIKRRSMDAVLTTMLAEQAIPGFEAQALAQELAQALGCAGAAALREYTRACTLALGALEVGPGRRVGVPALAAREWFDALVSLGAEPVILDVQAQNPTLDPALVSAAHASTPLDALVVSHSLGYLADLPALEALGIPLVEDISHAWGHDCSEFAAGSRGAAVVLAMETDGIVSAGGGAAVAWRSNAALALGRQILAQGPATTVLGDVNASLGRTQLVEAPYFLERRDELAKALHHALGRSRHRPPRTLFEGENPRYSMPVLVDSGVPDVVAYARKKGLDTQGAFSGSVMHHWSAEADPASFPRAQGFLLRCLLFPLHPGIRQKELETLERVLATLP